MAGFEHFDLLAPIYDHFIHTPDTAALASILNPDPSDLLLDAGGGTGRIAKTLSGMVRSVVITDASLPMLRQARGKSNIFLAASFSETLPFPDGSFQKIIMVDALHHIIDHQQTIAELWRVLAPGGTLVIEEPDIHIFGVKLLALAEKLAFFRSHFLSSERIASMLRDLGADPRIHPDPPNVRIKVTRNVSGS